MHGSALVLTLCTTSLLLHTVLPPRDAVAGYACEQNASATPLQYRFNGFATLVCVVWLGYLLDAAELVEAAALAKEFWPALATACGLGLALSAFLYARGRGRKVDKGTSCRTVSGPRSAAARSSIDFEARSFLEHFYCGLEWNPRVLGVDVKMVNYLVGAVVLACNALSALALHVEIRGDGSASNAMCVYISCVLFFVGEYMWYEHVHVYTYDIFRERTGAKMCWGCFCFYPFFYCVGVWPLVDSASDISRSAALACGALYAAGWCLTRGANLQKWAWRTRSARGAATLATTLFSGLVRSVAVPGSNGRLLCTGFWGLARHVNYCGEIVQGVALALPGWLATGSLLPWLYPIYYVLLFVPRQIDDDKSCAEKYGEVWSTYTALVPYRIVPGVY